MKKKSSSCKKGEILRKGYTKKNGTKVKSGCIRATSQSGKKRSDIDKKIIKAKSKQHKAAREKFGYPKKCSTGEILREGYHKKSYSKSSSKGKVSRVKSSWTPPTCIKSQTGRPKGHQLFVLEEGVLEKYGYTGISNKSQNKRHAALKSALKDINPLSLMRRINALYVLNKNKNPDLAQKFHDDAAFIKSTKEYQNRPTDVKRKKTSKK